MTTSLVHAVGHETSYCIIVDIRQPKQMDYHHSRINHYHGQRKSHVVAWATRRRSCMHGYCEAYTNARYKIKLKERMHRHVQSWGLTNYVAEVGIRHTYARVYRYQACFCIDYAVSLWTSFSSHSTKNKKRWCHLCHSCFVIYSKSFWCHHHKWWW